jgi:hypothetical protein
MKSLSAEGSLGLIFLYATKSQKGQVTFQGPIALFTNFHYSVVLYCDAIIQDEIANSSNVG